LRCDLPNGGTETVLLGWRGFAGWRGRVGSPYPVVGFRSCGEFLDEGSNGPDFLVGSFGKIESWHAGHVDAIADDPENLRGCEILDHILEIWRVGAQTSENFAHMTPGPP
jgi:hypothetical protein